MRKEEHAMASYDSNRYQLAKCGLQFIHLLLFFVARVMQFHTKRFP